MIDSLEGSVRRLLQKFLGRILIVEDEPYLQEILQKFFTGRGYHVTIAGDLAQAKACLKNEQFDIVLHDVCLPDGDGVEALMEMKINYPKLPVIILTSLGYDEDILQEAVRNGAAGYLSKLLPLDQILMEVHRVLKTAK